MLFEIYNPYENQAVTSLYVNTIEAGIANAGCNCEHVSQLGYGRSVRDKGIVVVSPIDAVKARLAGYRCIILWVQGLMAEESYMRNRRLLRKGILQQIMRRALQFSDLVLFVSHEMEEYYSSIFGMREINSIIMPCFDRDFPFFSQFENADNKTINTFLYAGSLAPWQCFDETARFYSAIEKQVRDAKLLVLTPDMAKAETILKRNKICNYEVDYVQSSDFRERISKIKYGLCLREDSPVNAVATPTKLSSYITSGIIPIYSSSIKSFSAVAKDSKYCVEVHSYPFSSSDVKSVIDATTMGPTKEELYSDFFSCFGSYYSRKTYVSAIEGKVRRLCLCV